MSKNKIKIKDTHGKGRGKNLKKYPHYHSPSVYIEVLHHTPFMKLQTIKYIFEQGGRETFSFNVTINYILCILSIF